jgi:Domain of unknown function (DUF5679)
MVLGYCIVCKATRELSDVKPPIQRSGLPSVEGKCSICGAQTFVLGADLPSPQPEHGAEGG